MQQPKQIQNQTSALGQAYQPLAGTFDEAVMETGELRDHWSRLLKNLQGLGSKNLSECQTKAQRILRDDGANYKPRSDQQRVWELDPTPLLIAKETWQNIETGLLQRAELFSRLLLDVYGKQEVIRQGVIPPEAIFAHPGFLRPCFDIEWPSEHALLLHAVDMVRTPNQSVCIIGDRTQAPSGAGYALENRTVMNRVFPNLFRDNPAQRLWMFFQTLRHKLNSFNDNGELPNIVVLTPGSYSESYFEHAHLANYLGYSLVQGRDLTVRNGYVWTKSLSGLSRVDVILRRVDDYFCDPSELKSDSYLGVPGLLEVIRAKRVVVANPLGSGILENPVFLKYLPAISQLLLGEELRLPSVSTHWAYDHEDREFILDNLTHLMIKPVFKSPGSYSVLGSELSPKELNDWQQRILSQPLKYVAQEFISPSCAPSWQQQQFAPLPVILRGFIVAGESCYQVMPGGLTRVGRKAGDRVISNQSSAISKDTWVLLEEPEKQVRLWAGNREPIVKEQQQSLPSRVIENMYWLGRYAVRAECKLRFLRTVFLQLNHTQSLSPTSCRTILRAVTQITDTYPGFTVGDSRLFESPEAELLSVTIDANRTNSVVSDLNKMLNCAEEVTALLSADTQRVINDIRDNVNLLDKGIRSDFSSAPEEALDPLVTSLSALSGLIHESMNRDYGWHFMEIGRNLERCYQTLSMIGALLVPVLSEYHQDSVLETLLSTLETLTTYRYRYRGHTDAVNILKLMILDHSNPRSLSYLLKDLQRHIQALPERHKSNFLTTEQRLVLELTSRVQLTQPKLLCAVDKSTKTREALNGLVSESQSLLDNLAAILADHYFDHAETQHQIMKNRWEDEL